MTQSDANLPYPSSLEAEKALLGSMMISPEEVIPRVRGVVAAEDFHWPHHRLLYTLLLEKTDAHQPIEGVSLLQTLMDRGKVEEIGGAATLTELMSFVPVGAHWEYYADVIRDKAIRRQGMGQMTELWKAFHDAGKDWRESVASAQQILSAMLAGRQKNRPLTMAEVMSRTADVIQERVENQGKIVGGLCTGFTDLDRMFQGIASPSIVTIGGRPSMGKSVLLLDIAINIAMGEGHYDEFCQERRTVLFVSTEMSYEDLGQRATAARAGINIKRFTDGFMPSGDFQRLTYVMGDLGQATLHIAYLPGASAESIASLIHSFAAQHPDLGAIVIDHMTDVGCDAVKDKGNQTALTTMAWQIVTDAIKRVNTVAFLGCQLNRDSSGKLPQLSDLRQSGKIEEVSSHVVFIHRQYYYELAKATPDPDVDPEGATLMVAKNRNGRRGPVPAYFDAEVTRFRSSTRSLYSTDAEERQEKMSIHNKHKH